MHNRLLHWVLSRPRVIAIGAAILVTDAAVFTCWLLTPTMVSVFGPNPAVCQRAAQTRDPRAISLCCAAESWPPLAICEGSAAARRREAEDAKAIAVLRSRRGRWEQQEPAHYRYSFQFTCFMCPGVGYTFTSDVLDGAPTVTASGEGQSGAPPDYAWAEGYATIDRVFEAAETAIKENPSSYVEYSSRWGYPRELAWGIPPAIASDSMTTFEVVDFEVLP